MTNTIHRHARLDLIKLGGPFAHFIATRQGWTIIGQPPAEPKYVLIGAPHTSNWDFLYFVYLIYYFRIRVKWLAKDSLFPWPFRRLHIALGGIPIDRSKANHMVEQIADAYQQADELVILIPPEGTRRYRDHWKSGFYHIARAADVPVSLGFIDYARKQFGFGPTLTLSGDVQADMANIAAFYADKTGKNPEAYGTPRFREHLEMPAS